MQKGQAGRSTGRSSGGLALASLLPTPLLVFVSSARELYLKNQEDLDYQVSVLAPFAVLFLITWLLGALLSRHSARRSVLRVLWGYYLAAPFVLSYKFLAGVSQGSRLEALVASHWALSLWLFVFAAAVFFVSARLAVRIVVTPMAAFGCLLLGGELYAFTTDLRMPENGRSTLEMSPEAAGSGPNIYHLVFDALQTQLVELAAGPELEERLGGFFYFPRNRAIYHSTKMSLASTFSSSVYRYQEPRGRFIREAMGGHSFVTRLSRAGFFALARVPATDGIDESLFDHVAFHSQHSSEGAPEGTATFLKLWLFSNAPELGKQWLLVSRWLSAKTRREFQLIASGRALADSAPLMSHSSFRNLLEEEEGYPTEGRYTFVHLLLPHDPYVLSSDCTSEGGERTGPLAQTLCALKLLGDFTKRLQSLGRFRDALIVVHGDHGGPYRLVGGELTRRRARSLTTPLWIKPPGVSSDEPYQTCGEKESTLLDVAPTVLELSGLPPAHGLEGSSMAAALRRCSGDEDEPRSQRM